MHGANATGRPFTGDHAGIISTRRCTSSVSAVPVSRSADDGLGAAQLPHQHAVRRLPPANKPLPAEVRNCNPYLADELASLPAGSIVLALGPDAHEAVLLALDLKKTAFAFAHGAWHELPVLEYRDSCWPIPIIAALQHPDPPSDRSDVPRGFRAYPRTSRP